MKLSYHPDTDTLYIHFSDRESVESEEMAPGFVLDFDEADAVVGVEIEAASLTVDLTSLESLSLPAPTKPRKRVITALKDGTALYRSTETRRPRRPK